MLPLSEIKRISQNSNLATKPLSHSKLAPPCSQKTSKKGLLMEPRAVAQVAWRWVLGTLARHHGAAARVNPSMCVVWAAGGCVNTTWKAREIRRKMVMGTVSSPFYHFSIWELNTDKHERTNSLGLG